MQLLSQATAAGDHHCLEEGILEFAALLGPHLENHAGFFDDLADLLAFLDR